MKLPIVKILISVTILLAMCGIAPAATVTQSIPYQGMLTDSSGNPLTGTYSVTFRLYDVATGGTALATDTHSVTTTQGLFTTTLTFGPQYFDGRALWLGVKVGSDAEMTPRQPLQPVPYALGLRPGANITGDATTNPSLKVINTAANTAGLIAGSLGENSPAVLAMAQGAKSPAVYALSQNDVGVYGKGKEGGFFTPNQAGIVWPGNPGVNISTTYDYNPGVRVYTSGDDSYGVIAVTDGDNSDGVYAYTGGPSSDGMHAMTTGPNSVALRGESAQDVGVYGKGKEGAFFTTNQAGTFWSSYPGVNVSTGFDHDPGVFINTSGDYSEGVVAYTYGEYSEGVWAETYGDGSAGVVARTYNASSPGVWAHSAQSEGVVGIAVSAAGVKGSSETKAGVWGVSGNDVGVYAVTDRADDMYGIYTPDYLYAKGAQYPLSDVAEYMAVAETVTPGTVLVIGADGRLAPSTTAYDTRVAGIVSTAPGIFLGTKEDGNPGEALIAVAGRVPCKVDASYGAIHPGDLLTTSDTPGYAMKASDPKIGTILGKAMGSLESGTGVIEVLVTLQ